MIITPAVCVLYISCTGSQTVEQIKKNLWSFMRLVNINNIRTSCIVLTGFVGAMYIVI